MTEGWQQIEDARIYMHTWVIFIADDVWLSNKIRACMYFIFFNF